MRPWLLIFTALLAVLLPGCSSCQNPIALNPAPFQCDAANRLTNTISPLLWKTSVVFNHQGLPTLLTDPASQNTTNTFDARACLITRGDKLAVTTNSYDGNNHLTNCVENGKTNSWTYDAYNRVSSYRDTAGNLIQYRYDANANLTNLIYPGGLTVAYSYDSLNHLTNVTDWTGRKTTLAYDLDGHLTGITRPNGTFRTISYDSAGEVTNIWEQMANGLPIAWFRLNWTNSGNMAWEFAAPLPHAVTVPTRTMTYDADNRLHTFNGQIVYSDLDGNLTNGPILTTPFTNYTYDARNRLLNAGSVTNAYDAINNRIGQTFGTNTTTYVINPVAKLPQVLMRIKNGVTNYYIYGAGLLYQTTTTGTNTSTLTYHYDYRGSTIALTADNGLVADRIEYSLYGLTTYRAGTTDTPFLFNGRYGVQTDPNGLLYMRARYYNPYLCRFINPDPSGFKGGLNFYAYANGNPVSYLDPFGLCADSTGDTENSSLYYNQLNAVDLNNAPANIPGGALLDLLGFDHQWISTSTGESAGMGNMNGLPGDNGQTSPDLPFSPTEVVDHTGRDPAFTQSFVGVNQTALSSYLQVGQPTGPWIPLVNDCNTWAATALQNSTPQTTSVSGTATFLSNVNNVTGVFSTVIYANGTVYIVSPAH